MEMRAFWRPQATSRTTGFDECRILRLQGLVGVTFTEAHAESYFLRTSRTALAEARHIHHARAEKLPARGSPAQRENQTSVVERKGQLNDLVCDYVHICDHAESGDSRVAA